MQPEPSKRITKAKAQRSARVLLARLGWLRGFPADAGGRIVWSAPDGPRAVDAKHLADAARIRTRLRVEFPRALPAIVGDRKRWLAWTDERLRIIRCIHTERDPAERRFIRFALLGRGRSGAWDAGLLARFRDDESSPRRVRLIAAALAPPESRRNATAEETDARRILDLPSSDPRRVAGIGLLAGGLRRPSIAAFLRALPAAESIDAAIVAWSHALETYREGVRQVMGRLPAIVDALVPLFEVCDAERAAKVLILLSRARPIARKRSSGSSPPTRSRASARAGRRGTLTSSARAGPRRPA